MAAPTMHKLAVVIPCYNEAASITNVLQGFDRHELRQRGVDLQIYVVDNNSTDATAELAQKAGATVLYEAKKGKGNALRAGFRTLPDDIDFVVMLDGDNTYSPQEVMRLIEPLQHDFCDAVIGSRLGGQIQQTAMSRVSRIGNNFFTAAVRSLYRANVTDVLTGYFAWKKQALDALAPQVNSPGFAIEMEMITKMTRLGLRLASVPISYHPRAGESNLHPYKDGVRILAMLIRTLVWQPEAPAHQSHAQSDKIVFVSDAIYPYMKGGKEKRLFEISTRLAQMGNDVHIYTMKWWDGDTKTRIEHGVTLHAICKQYQMYHGDRRTIKEAIMFSLACFKLLRVHFDVLDVDHMPFFPILTTWLVCRLRRKKLHATWHEALTRQEWMDYMGIGGVLASLIERVSIRLPHCITAASFHTKELLVSNHNRIRRVELVASGIDVSLLKNVTPANIRCDVLYAGRLVKDKNLDVLLLAMKHVVKGQPAAQCLIIGQGVEKNRLKQQAVRLKLQQNVTFLNPLPDAADVYAYMKAAKVFCSPSAREGFGIAPLESLGCGTPVITVASPSNAARHLVQDGQNGSVVALEPEAIASAILHWISIAQKPAIDPHIAQWDWRQLAERQAEVYSS